MKPLQTSLAKLSITRQSVANDRIIIETHLTEDNWNYFCIFNFLLLSFLKEIWRENEIYYQSFK